MPIVAQERDRNIRRLALIDIQIDLFAAQERLLPLLQKDPGALHLWVMKFSSLRSTDWDHHSK